MSREISGFWTRWRLRVQTAAFVLLVAIPILNYFHIDFVQGWYQSLSIGDLWFVSPLEGLERILVTKTFYGPLLVGMLIPVLVALTLGRVFCGWVCPIHFLSEISDRLRSLFGGKLYPPDRWRLPRFTLWWALAGELLLAMILGAPLFVFLSPPGLVGRELLRLVFFQTLALEGLIIVAVLLLNLLTRRFFCRYLCPLGALLVLLGQKRRLRIELQSGACIQCAQCDQACPLGLTVSLGEGAGLHCWNCGTCVDQCQHAALQLTLMSSQKPIHGPSSN